MMKKDSTILIVGHNDVMERSLYRYFSAQEGLTVFSSSDIALNTTIQSSVYAFFSKYRPDYIFLGSTRAGGIQANLDHPAEFMYHNSETQNNILYSANKFGAQKVFYFSASCVYPKDCAQPMKEEYLMQGPLESTSGPYSLAKLSGMMLCQAFRQQYGLQTRVIVPATIYGPECDVDLTRAHVLGATIAKFAQAVKQDEDRVVIWGTGSPRREFLFIDDFIQAVLFLMRNNDHSDFINVGFGEDISIKELAEMVADISGYTGKIVYDDSKPDGAPQKLLDNLRMTRLGWVPKVSLREGIEKTYQWYYSTMAN